ncbi:amidohydrolase family protein [Microbacterium sp. ASV81]|uniref:Amidohydrolase family protein n=1 Tax=Microbacterium capsulatum TaxID=3041921 RepID=A0ABU0XKP8_9MICO|nr:amidohydrolase family protein [Microbacterium sp. ASV81]MDQ4214695.1 amidohydrolase family protein [Microbacterium sp. ASV81]
MTRIVITGGAVLTADPAQPLRHGVDVVIEDDTIVSVGPDADITGAEVIDARGSIVMPGLVDTHLHVWEYGWRGIMMRKNTKYDYIELLWKTGAGYQSVDTYESTLGASMDGINNGVTGVLDFMHGANTTDAHTDGAVSAYRETGQRVMLAVGSRKPYTAPAAEFDAARAARIADVARLREATRGDALIDPGVALVTPDGGRLWEQFVQDIGASRDMGARMTFHANEIGEFHRMDQAGLLGSDIVPSHGNRASEIELKALAEHDVVLSVSPYSEVSSGKSPAMWNRAVRAGVRLALSVDVPPGIIPISEFAQMRQFWAVLNVFDRLDAREGGRFGGPYALDPHTLTLDEVVEAGTYNGALALGYENLGRIAPGQLADVIVVRPEPGDVVLEDPAAYVVMSTPSSHEVSHVIIGGVVRKRDGVLTDADRLDLAAVNAHCRERVMRIVEG